MLVEATAGNFLKFSQYLSCVDKRRPQARRSTLLPEMHPEDLCSLKGAGRRAALLLRKGIPVLCSQSPHHRLTLLTSVENLNETREQKEKSPPDQSAVPNTPPSTPVKLEEGESCHQ